MTEIEIMKELFVALSSGKSVTLELKDGSTATGHVRSFDGINILLDDANVTVVESVPMHAMKALLIS